MSGRAIDFSIIVPTHDRPALGHCLEALSRLDYPADRFEVIVVDDGSRVSPRELVDSYSARIDLRLLDERRGGPAAARNAGARVARGSWLAFTADDCRPAPCWLRSLAAHFEVRGEEAVAGRIVNGARRSRCAEAAQVLNEYLYLHFNRGAGNGFSTPNNLAVPAEGFRRLGGFDTSYSYAGEDRDFCARWVESGRRIGYCADARVEHVHPLSPLGFLYQQFRYGRGSLRFHRRRAARRHARLRFERPGFYRDLVLYPMRIRGLAGVPLAGLLGLAQAMIVLGTATEVIAGARSRRLRLGRRQAIRGSRR